jgi:hypothetical protein
MSSSARVSSARATRPARLRHIRNVRMVENWRRKTSHSTSFGFPKEHSSSSRWTTVEIVAEIWLSAWIEWEICQSIPLHEMEVLPRRLARRPSISKSSMRGKISTQSFPRSKRIRACWNRVNLGPIERSMNLERCANRKPTG